MSQPREHDRGGTVDSTGATRTLDPIEGRGPGIPKVAGELGYRSLELARGDDVWQLHVVLHALGHDRPSADSIPRDGPHRTCTEATAEAVDAFRAEQGLSTAESGSPPGLVDQRTVEELWDRLESEGMAAALRERFSEVVRVRR